MAAVAQSGDKRTFCSCLKRMRVAPPNEGVQTVEGHLGSERTGQRRGLSCRLLVGPVLGFAPASLWIGGQGAKAGRGSGNGATRPAKLLLENPANVFKLGQAVHFRGPGKAKQPGEVYRTFSDPRSAPPHNQLTAQPPGPPGDCPRTVPKGWLLPLGLGFSSCEMRGECSSSKATPVCGDPGRGRPRETLRTGHRGLADARRAGGSAERGRRRPVRSDSAPDRGPRLPSRPPTPKPGDGTPCLADLPRSSP